MEQGRSLTVVEELEEGWRVGGFYHGLPLRHAASAKGHCNVTIMWHVTSS